MGSPLSIDLWDKHIACAVLRLVNSRYKYDARAWGRLPSEASWGRLKGGQRKTPQFGVQI